MAIFTEGMDRAKLGSEVDNATDAAAAFKRVEPLITVEQLKERYLFGIPLVAAMPDPITKVRQRMTDAMLADSIDRACSTAEAEVGSGFHITPVEVTRRVPFDRAEYRSLGFFRLPEAPILRVLGLDVKTADGTAVYRVPLNWCDPGQFKKGQINLIPLTAAFLGTGGSMTPTADGGAAWLSILGQGGWVASYWEARVICGIDQGHMPLFINELIGLIAAIDLLSKLAATYRISSYSTGLDAASQSVSGPGPALYDAAIERMEKEKAVKLNKVKALFYKKIFCDNV
jgi:hypothetical protein